MSGQITRRRFIQAAVVSGATVVALPALSVAAKDPPATSTAKPIKPTSAGSVTKTGQVATTKPPSPKKVKKITPADRQAAAKRLKAARQGIAASTLAAEPVPKPGDPPRYFTMPNYANSPQRVSNAVINFTGGGGTGATATATVDAATGAITAITVLAGGSGYTSAPTVDIASTGTGTGAAATATISGAVTAIAVDNPGSGYFDATTVTVDIAGGGGTGATATANVDTVAGTITSITVTNGGSGYTSAPTVTINDSAATPGSGAAATATISGAVTAVTVTSPGSGYVTKGIRKFVDTLPGLGPSGANNLGQYIPVAVADTTTYPGSDYYEIAVVEFQEQMHSDLPAKTNLRGYVQLSTNVVPGKQVPLKYPDGSPIYLPKPDGTPDTTKPALAVDDPHYLGPAIIATKGKPVRVLFRNLLPTGHYDPVTGKRGGDLFIPVDTTVMGSGMGPGMAGMAEMDPQHPMAGEVPKPDGTFTENRATLHLHGGFSPWISDGTPHQWTTPAGDNTMYPKGVSVSLVPDMPDPGPGALTFFYTNDQSARLMFYHDHAWGITRLNVYVGEAAPYVVNDPMEQTLISNGLIPGPADTLYLVVQDKTFVPSQADLDWQDPTWDSQRWGGEGQLWMPHVYVPAQNPGDSSGVNPYGRWAYGPWFWPPTNNIAHGPISNPDAEVSVPWSDSSDPARAEPAWFTNNHTPVVGEPPEMPGTPFLSMGMEAFNDTVMVNGTVYPMTTVEPKPYRLRFLNAANDRFFNLSLYQAANPDINVPMWNPDGSLNDPNVGEVALNAAEVAAGKTDPAGVFPTPDTTKSPPGPDWIQIGSEGGFLPAPAVIPAQHITWVTDPTVFNAGNVDKHSLLLGPAERADVIVDFSQFAGKWLILYNDAPAAFPARDPRYDYYTDHADLTDTGGAPPTPPGYGPNTRTVMLIKVANTAPSPAYNLTALQNAFKSTQLGGLGVFETSQPPIIVGQAAYNSAYNSTFIANSSTKPYRDGFARITDFWMYFNTLTSQGANQLARIDFETKAIQDEMGEAFEQDYGRMSGNLGLEVKQVTAGVLQKLILYPYVNPPDAIINAVTAPGPVAIDPTAPANAQNITDGTQIWKITHNGVDTHPIHFHLFDVQLLNRVGWDGIIRPPDPNELGWKETIRVSPLEDTIVALRPRAPKLPFGLPDSIRPLNPMMPLGSTAMFNSTDANGNPINPPISNVNYNFGHEYVWHCHILSHEEMDMMRPMQFNVPRQLPPAPVVLYTRNGGVNLTWTDATPANDPATWGNPANEVGYIVQRAPVNNNGSAGTYAEIGRALANATSFADAAAGSTTRYYYRVIAWNAAGSSTSMPVLVGPIGVAAPAAPSNLTGVLQAGPQVSLTWRDNATNETGFVVERSATSGNGPWTPIATPPARSNTGTVTYVDTTVAGGVSSVTYWYRVYAVNGGGASGYSNVYSVTLPPVPAAPSSFTATAARATGNNDTVTLKWTDNASNETGFTIQRATDAAFTSGLNTANVAANTTTLTQTGLNRNVNYYYRIRAVNGAVASAWVNATPFPILTP